MSTKYGLRKEPLIVHHVILQIHPNNMEQVFILVTIPTNMFKIIMKPFQQVCNLKYIILRSITPTQPLIFIGNILQMVSNSEE
jgi:hypothetical protein